MTVPAKRKKEREPRRFDTTSCRESGYHKIVHRDYLAHTFRWGWASRLIQPGMRVLDVGCGPDAPLAHVLSGTNFVHGGEYLGVDYNKSIKGHGKTWCKTLPEFDFTARYKELGLFDVVVNFEVIEHMEPADGEQLLVGMRECLAATGRLLLSTPVIDPVRGQAANHIHEYRVDELQSLIEKCGLAVEKRFGTFASYPPLKKVVTAEERAIWERVREFYGDDVTACFLAPLYPDHSRNNAWVLRRAE